MLILIVYSFIIYNGSRSSYQSVQSLPQKILNSVPFLTGSADDIMSHEYFDSYCKISIRNLSTRSLDYQFRFSAFCTYAPCFYFSCFICDWYLWYKGRNRNWKCSLPHRNWIKSVRKWLFFMGYSRPSHCWHRKTLYFELSGKDIS